MSGPSEEHGPSEEQRRQFAQGASGARDEAALDQLLQEIELAITDDRSMTEPQRFSPEEVLTAVEVWASVISDVLLRFYGQSPLRQSIAGWGGRIVRRLREISQRLMTPLSVVSHALGADSFGICVNFPLGVSVGLNWPATTPPQAAGP